MSAPHVPPPFHALVEHDDGGTLVRFIGELDLSTAGEAETVVERARQEGHGPLRIDLSELTFVDSSGLRLIMQIHADCQKNGRELSLVPGPRGVQRALDVAGVLQVLPFVDQAR